MRPDTVFLDRDGTINRKPAEGDYVESVAGFELLPGAGAGIRALNEHGARVIVVTNQRGIALGRMSARAVDEIHAHMRDELAVHGACVDAVYVCPHERAVCGCRKPGVGLFLRAARDFPALRLQDSAMIGDSITDMQAAARLGLTRVLVGAGTDVDEELAAAGIEIDLRARDLLRAARRLVARSGAMVA
jgi:D-glycero-D-manno-heptose 1,7-bisphosphate phosphatase